MSRSRIVGVKELDPCYERRLGGYAYRTGMNIGLYC